jgi:hypothetical protein
LKKLSISVCILGLAVICLGLAVIHAQQSATGSNYTPIMIGTTGNIGGSALLAGACSTGTAAVLGAVPGMPVDVTASDGTNIPALGVALSGTVTSSGTVTVSVCALVALTPASKTYNVRVIP